VQYGCCCSTAQHSSSCGKARAKAAAVACTSACAYVHQWILRQCSCFRCCISGLQDIMAQRTAAAGCSAVHLPNTPAAPLLACCNMQLLSCRHLQAGGRLNMHHQLFQQLFQQLGSAGLAGFNYSVHLTRCSCRSWRPEALPKRPPSSECTAPR
jgi:hypothetical protein